MRQDFTGLELFAARQLAWADLYHFSRWMFLHRKGFKWQQAKHHRMICDALMRVFNGQTKRLIINIPPRYSKTELAVVNFISWAFGRVPDSEFIHVSYSSELATNNSAQIRSLVQHEEYKAIFPGLALASDAKHHWKTTAGGVMYATGTGGTITGFGAGKHREGFGGAIIIDDPHKADEARSDVIRQSVLDWFQTTLESRKNSPDTPIIVIMQRLHEEDLAGWLEAQGNGESWEVLRLSAWGDGGEPLWPEKHSAELLKQMELAAPYVFAGQYRQMPAPPDGELFKPDRLTVVDAIPSGVSKWMRAWDMASVTNAGDWTAGARLGRLPDGRYIIADIARFQRGPDERDKAILSTATQDGDDTWIGLPQDPGQAGKTQIAYMTRMLASYRVESSPETGDKITRAEPFAAQVNAGNVLMLRGEWNRHLINEMRMFPNGKNDDQIDACSRAFAGVALAKTSFFDLFFE